MGVQCVTMRRRHFLGMAVAGIAGGADMITRAARPEDLEMPLSGFSDYLTPAEHFFVRSHVYVPSVDVSSWRLRVEGSVATPLTLDMASLRGLPSVELDCVAECAGNGRAFYDPPMPGLQWTHGAVGNGRWRGVRLADVLRRAGVAASAREVLFEGADAPLATMPDFQRSIPIAKALDQNTLLAFEMNGSPLPVKHGFPLRVIAPGWAGDSWVKWLTEIRVLDKEHDGFWMKSAYLHPGTGVAPGSAVAADQMRPVTSLRVKSVIASPESGTQVVAGKPLSIRGTAWSGDAGPVTSVDVSVDGGRMWEAATLLGKRTQFGWRQWEFTWTPARIGYVTILARARDAAGNTQPMEQEWNPSGYLWNVVQRVGVDVVRELRSVVPSPASAPAQTSPVISACTGCHGDDVIRQQRLTRAQWDREVTKMTGWGARLRDEDRAGLLDFLFTNFGPRPR